jgi:hypothetical protein
MKSTPTQPGMASERDLIALALALGARSVAPWSPAEEALARGAPRVSEGAVAGARRRLAAGEDPLGEAFCALRPAVDRRGLGATYTPLPIVEAMVAWAVGQDGGVMRVVDPGPGSGRFLIRAGRRLPAAELWGVELDPVAALLARAQLAAAGLAKRARLIVADYRDVALPGHDGRTLYIGNPPYVRHHLIPARWKAWLARTATARGLPASRLAGLHAYFFLATVEKARPGDYGAFITAAEWLDVNYGRLIRELVTGALGGRSIHMIEPTGAPFPDAQTTAAITCFEIGARPRSIRMRRVPAGEPVGSLEAGRPVRRERLDTAGRWTALLHAGPRNGQGLIELGELCRVHRGQVTGANRVWIAGPDSPPLPASVLFPAVTRARELFIPDGRLADAAMLRRVIDLPIELDRVEAEERRLIDRFLRWAHRLGAHLGYIARTRRAWWSVGLREPAPILATYMARRSPGFARNLAGARHINIAHGIYPRELMPEATLTALVRYLSTSVSVRDGRTYAGGLTKFEPREMERLLVPEPNRLAGEAHSPGPTAVLAPASLVARS